VSSYEVVAECRLRVLLDADAALTEESVIEVFGAMLHAGVEEYFGILRETAIAVKSAVLLDDGCADRPT
jgi:hypothetical protein